jgi:hypothetical protein
VLNTQNFILLAGHPEKWDAEFENLSDRGESLVRLQEDQSRRGRIPAHLVLSMYGWTVRYASGLQGFGILHKSGSFDPANAVEWGTQWVNRDADKRELFVSVRDVERAESDGHDCSVIRRIRDEKHS